VWRGILVFISPINIYIDNGNNSSLTEEDIKSYVNEVEKERDMIDSCPIIGAGEFADRCSVLSSYIGLFSTSVVNSEFW